MNNKNTTNTNIIANFNTEVKQDFLEYALSVITSRAVPDIFDGLKPVQRRIIYTMYTLKIFNNTAFKKSARIVGEVMGKFHPHGDSSIYEAMVRMAQKFSLRYPLIQGHGNFGSIDGDPPAAMRYTEAKMSKISEEIIKDIDKDVIKFIDNYDSSEKEPLYLPSIIPNLLLNGAKGIAVGMATNIPPHNLSEVINALLYLIENPGASVKDLLKFIKGPDFPTGAQLIKNKLTLQGYETGSGSVTMKAKICTETFNNNEHIIVEAIPYQINKKSLLEKIVSLIKEKTIVNILELNDESNYKGMRIVIKLNKKANSNLIINKLLKLTPLQTNFNFNFLVIKNGVPVKINLKEILNVFLINRTKILLRKTKYDINKNQDSLNILNALIIAVNNFNEVVEIIKNSPNNDISQQKLIEKFNLKPNQAKAIINMRLGRLNSLEKSKLINKAKEIQSNLNKWKKILINKEIQKQIITDDLNRLKNNYSDKRRTEIIQSDNIDIEDEDLIPEKKVCLVLTHNNYIKRIEQSDFKLQKHGGRGVRGVNKRNSDIKIILESHTHNTLLFFTNKGKVYHLRTFEVKEATKSTLGIPIINLLNIEQNETIETILNLDRDVNKRKPFIIFATKKGLVKKIKIDEFNKINKKGKKAISIKDNDELISARLADDSSEVILVNSNAKLMKFSANKIRPSRRQASGVIGIKNRQSEVLNLDVHDPSEENYIFVISEKGYGKVNNINDFRKTNRGGVGVTCFKISEKTKKLKFAKVVKTISNMLIATKNGQVIKINTQDLRVHKNRITSGVKLINLSPDDSVKEVEVFKI